MRLQGSSKKNWLKLKGIGTHDAFTTKAGDVFLWHTVNISSITFLYIRVPRTEDRLREIFTALSPKRKAKTRKKKLNKTY